MAALLGTHQTLRDQLDYLHSYLTIDLVEDELYIGEAIDEKHTEHTFVLGQELEELTLDGRIVRTVFILESERLLRQIQRHGFSETVITREVKDGVLTSVVRTPEATAILKFHRIGSPRRRPTIRRSNPNVLQPPLTPN
ncbi:fatty acid-binding protein [Clonorchis sinensis]|uniref:Fatty acid-binding protein n=1 Tax=Clonorchis sinensis TaxID=79923 RepID=G7YFT6_CLOSI|nr:fatty acid-binding protein [Clonorchis sinensis]